MAEDLGERSHYLGDSCRGGHRDDPYEASRLNDELIERELAEATAALEAPGVLSDRQAALFAAVQQHGPSSSLWNGERCAEEILAVAGRFVGWLGGEEDDDG